MKQISHLVAQFDTMRFTKDGGIKLTLEFSADCIKELQKIQNWVSLGEMNLAVAVSPLNSAKFSDLEIENLEY